MPAGLASLDFLRVAIWLRSPVPGLATAPIRRWIRQIELVADRILSCSSYPGRLVLKSGPELAPELTITSNTPATFLVQTCDDPVHVENSLFYGLALKKAGVPVEMHIFVRGGHGYGLRSSENAVSSWPLRAEEWMRGLGVLPGKGP